MRRHGFIILQCIFYRLPTHVHMYTCTHIHTYTCTHVRGVSTVWRQNLLTRLFLNLI